MKGAAVRNTVGIAVGKMLENGRDSPIDLQAD